MSARCCLVLVLVLPGCWSWAPTSFLASCKPRSCARSLQAATTSVEQGVAQLHESVDVPPQSAPARTTIIGGGPAGLATAIMLARRGWQNIHIYERLGPPPDPDDSETWTDTARFYLIGLGGRGQRALASLGAWEEVKSYCTAVVGRRDWSPGSGGAPEDGVERIFTDRPYLTEVLARDRLAGVLSRIVQRDYSDQVTVQYHTECDALEWKTDESVVVQFSQSDESGSREAFDVETPFLVAADGVARTVVDEVNRVETEALSSSGIVRRAAAAVLPNQQPVKVIRYPDDNVRVYKTVPFRLPGEGDEELASTFSFKWRKDVNYSARTADGRIVFDALPASANGDYCGVLLLRPDDPLAQSNVDEKELRRELDRLLPQFSKLLDDKTISAVAQKPSSRLPAFRYISPRLHHRKSTVFLGDAIHTVKPYFGLGVNSAFEDVMVLEQSLAETGSDDPALAAPAYSQARAGEAAALVQLSRGFDRPGKLGFITFVLPLILDGIFHGMAPRIFAPNTIAMLQRQGLTFQGVVSRKRRDRLLQVTILATGFTILAVSARVAFLALPGRSIVKLGALVGAILTAAAARKVLAATKHMAPADVLAKSRGPWDKSAPQEPSRGGHENLLMTQRMSQRGYGAEGQEGNQKATGDGDGI